MKHIIITGPSRGLGYFIVRKLIGQGFSFHLIARSDMRELSAEIEKQGETAFRYHYDLSETMGIEELMRRIMQRIDMTATDFITLINNAGMLQPIGPLGKYDAATYHQNLQVNFVAPVMLTHCFVAKVQRYRAVKRVIMISSGAGKNPYFGWSHYCSTKAGIDMLTRCIALEQEKMKFPVQCLSFNPGKMESDMQKEIRKTSREDFPKVEDFIRAKNQNELASAVHIAGLVTDLLLSPDFPAGRIIGRKELEKDATD